MRGDGIAQRHGEGAGPPDNVQEVVDTFAAFRAEFPGAEVVSTSTCREPGG